LANSYSRLDPMLKRESDGGSELFLAHPKKGTALAHARHDVNIDWM
jgi:hypothetical protein